MLRQLLTLLAVITGLAATGQVAQARMAGLESTTLQSASLATSDCVEQRPAPVAMLTRSERQKSENRPCAPARPAPAPTVMLGPDRALE